MSDMEKIEIKDLIDSLTEDEFGAVSAIVNWLNDNGGPFGKVKLNEAILERAEKEVNGTEA